jgi:ABC-2 type transport system ATP-binding protein
VDPDILIIDEILAVGDASFQQKSLEKIEDFRKAGKTIILVSHGLSDVSRLCDTVAWLNKGTLQMLGDPYEVVPEYMGMSHNAKEKEEGEIGERWGSGEIQISKVELLNSSSPSSQLFETNSSMGIRIGLDSKIENTQIVVGVSISNLHGQHIWGTNTKLKGLSYIAPTGESHLDLSIDELLLLEGTYEISLTVADSAGVHEYDHWENKIRFTVNQNTNHDVGLITMKSRWVL